MSEQAASAPGASKTPVNPKKATSPQGNHPAYDELCKNIDELLLLLGAHPALQANLAAGAHKRPQIRNKAYHVYDFIVRTRRWLDDNVDPTLQTKDAAKKEVWSDCVQRSTMINILINDTTGKLSTMVREDPAHPIDFGQEIKVKAQNVVTKQIFDTMY